MERKLIVMRHAKSSWNSGVRTDHDRPLNKRGLRDAPRVGAALAERGWVPDLVLSSDSERTRETFAGLASSWPGDVEVKFLSSFYHGGPPDVRRAIGEVDDGVGCLLVLGHNPGWEDLASWLTDEHVVMKTATAALMTRELPSWREGCGERGTWALREVLYPREL